MVAYLPDTNILSAALDNDRHVVRMIRSADAVFLSSIVLGELLYGAQYSTKVRENMAAVRRIQNSFAIIDCDAGTAERYGELKTKLRRAGTPIPENDLWIAAQALQHGLTVATRDSDFRLVPGLQTVDWR